MKALREVGLRRVLRYALVVAQLAGLKLAFLPPLRTLVLRLYGARIGAGTVIQPLTIVNADRGGFSALRIGRDCFIGDEVLLDLAGPIELEDQVTLAARVMVLTHLNVGYSDHPLREHFPSMTAGVTIRRGSFVGAGSTVLAGVDIGEAAFVAAASLVNKPVPPGAVVGGVPARPLQAGAPGA